MKFSEWWNAGALGTFVSGGLSFQSCQDKDGKRHLYVRRVPGGPLAWEVGPIAAARLHFYTTPVNVIGTVVEEEKWDTASARIYVGPSPSWWMKGKAS